MADERSYIMSECWFSAKMLLGRFLQPLVPVPASIQASGMTATVISPGEARRRPPESWGMIPS
jgi:hypothetical protein